MKIALLGTRGIPNRYGGFEAFYEKLSQFLVNDGHEVSVYCRRSFSRPEDDARIDSRIRRIVLPSIPEKHLDTPTHTLLSVLHVIFTRVDLVLICNAANSPVAWIPRLFGKPVVLNVDGLDRQRKKWGPVARAVLSACEFLSVFTPSRVVTDSLAMQQYYHERYGKSSVMIGYGAEPPQLAIGNENSVLKRLGLAKKQYVLYVSRLEPENNPELVIRAFQKTRMPWPLVMVGSNAYDSAYERRLRELPTDDRVIFAGSIYGDGYWQLQLNAACFVFACEIGGIHPALVEAMAAATPVLYLNTESNRETADDSGIIFEHDEDDLTAKLQKGFENPKLLAEAAAKGLARARERYGWTRITRQYEDLFQELLGRDRS